MPTPIVLGAAEAHEKLTARVFFQPAGSAGYHDLGNVKEYNQAHEYSAVTRVIAEKGFRRTVDEQLDVVTAAWEFTLDEFDAKLLSILHAGSQGATVQQAAATAPAGTATINDLVCGRWYSIGKVGLDTLVATKGVTPLTAGTDYVADLDTGMIRFIDGTNLSDGDDVTLTFGADAVDFEVVTGLDAPDVRGDFILHETNQHSGVPLKTTTFTGTMHATEFPSHTGEFGTWKVKVTATNKPTVKRRSAA